jgi:hypothetical protein
MVWAGNTISQPSLEFSLIWSTLVAEEINGLHNHKKIKIRIRTFGFFIPSLTLILVEY